jgi:hypothetical protein
MRAPPGTLHVNKIAVAGRQLDAAIRMFFAKEDEFAIHSVAAAAFQILRDVTENRGKNSTRPGGGLAACHLADARPLSVA